MRIMTGLFATIVLTAGGTVLAKDCPSTVTAAAARMHVGATMLSCHTEHDDGVDLYEMKLETTDGRELELEIGTDGELIATEERIGSTNLPKIVSKAIKGKFGDVSVSESSRVTSAMGEVTYEIVCTSKGHLYSMTVKEDGTVVETEDEHDSDDENETQD